MASNINLSALREYIGFVCQYIALCNGLIIDHSAYDYLKESKPCLNISYLERNAMVIA
jgi:hypothetical protein